MRPTQKTYLEYDTNPSSESSLRAQSLFITKHGDRTLRSNSTSTVFQHLITRMNSEIDLKADTVIITNVDRDDINPFESARQWDERQRSLAKYWTRLRALTSENLILERIRSLQQEEENQRIVVYSCAAASGYNEQIL